MSRELGAPCAKLALAIASPIKHANTDATPTLSIFIVFLILTVDEARELSTIRSGVAAALTNAAAAISSRAERRRPVIARRMPPRGNSAPPSPAGLFATSLLPNCPELVDPMRYRAGYDAFLSP